MMFDDREHDHVMNTDKMRPTLPPTHEALIKKEENDEELKNFKIKNKDQLKTLIYLINQNYGVGAANNIGVKLKLKNHLPSDNFKTKKDFLQQLKIALLKEPDSDQTVVFLK